MQAVKWEYVIAWADSRGPDRYEWSVKYQTTPLIVTEHFEKDTSVTDLLGVLGRDGWELVSVAAIGTSNVTYWFKRQVKVG